MKKVLLYIILAIAVIAGGIWVYDWVLGDTLEASEPISAIPLETTPPDLAPLPTEMESPAVETEPATSTEADTGAESIAPEGNAMLFTILQTESQASFTIFEELNGAPTDVVGVTDQVAGEVSVDLADLSQTRLGVIQVNARTLATDQDRRNSAIRNRILLTDQYEFITFSPSQISGLSGSAETGQTFTFSILGDLTIRDITRPVSFDASVTVESAGRLSGSATAIIAKSDFNLIVPSVPFVANVGEDVTLEIDFVLVPSQ